MGNIKIIKGVFDTKLELLNTFYSMLLWFHI